MKIDSASDTSTWSHALLDLETSAKEAKILIPELLYRETHPSRHSRRRKVNWYVANVLLPMLGESATGFGIAVIIRRVVDMIGQRVEQAVREGSQIPSAQDIEATAGTQGEGEVGLPEVPRLEMTEAVRDSRVEAESSQHRGGREEVFDGGDDKDEERSFEDCTTVPETKS